MPTENLNLPMLMADQAQKHITHNAALDLLDAAAPATVISATTASAPASPADFDRYIVPNGSSFGAVTGGNVAIWVGGEWLPWSLPMGARLFVTDEGGQRIRTPVGWLPGVVAGAVTGAAFGPFVRDAVITLSGSSKQVNDLIPAGAIVHGVMSWTIEAVTGASSYSVGDSNDASRFGSLLGVSVGSANKGVVGPYATYAPDYVRVTRAGSNFTGGKVGVAVFGLAPSLPVVW